MAQKPPGCAGWHTHRTQARHTAEALCLISHTRPTSALPQAQPSCCIQFCSCSTVSCTSESCVHHHSAPLQRACLPTALRRQGGSRNTSAPKDSVSRAQSRQSGGRKAASSYRRMVQSLALSSCQVARWYMRTLARSSHGHGTKPLKACQAAPRPSRAPNVAGWLLPWGWLPALLLPEPTMA